MKWKCLTVFCLLFASLCLQGPAANASSVYDETYGTTNTLYVGDANCDFHAANITNTWSSYITDESRWGTENVSITEEAKQAFLDAQQNGDVSVSQVSWQQTPTRVGKYVTVYFSEDKAPPLEWSAWNQAVSVKGYQYGLLIGCNGGIDASHPTIWLFSTPANYTTGMLSQSSGYSSQSTANFFTTVAQNRPDGYAGADIATQPVRSAYVAMGDSFSSGEGNPVFETGTDTSSNKCHRSPYAYSNWLQQTPSLNLGLMDFVACSGATTQNVLYGGAANGAWGESPQVDALSVDAKVVTITIGGNDIGFKEFVTECILSSCDDTTNIYTDTLDSIHNDLPAKLGAVYAAILSRIGLNTTVYVIGYPYAAPATGLDSLPSQCGYLNGSYGYGRDAVAANKVATELNSVIQNAVVTFSYSHITSQFRFIDPNVSIDGTFDGHDVCQGANSYFHNVTPNDLLGNGDRSYILHPNVAGQYEYYKIVSGAIQ